MEEAAEQMLKIQISKKTSLNTHTEEEDNLEEEEVMEEVEEAAEQMLKIQIRKKTSLKTHTEEEEIEEIFKEDNSEALIVITTEVEEET